VTSEKKQWAGRPIQEPVCTTREGSIGGETFTHPAFSQISASRVSGVTVLYGSDFHHHNYVSLQIVPSELHRSLSNDRAHGRNVPYIEVNLSEAQWASFVSSMNVGSGTQCTLRYKDGAMVPGLPDPASRTEQFAGEASKTMDRANTELRELAEAIQTSGLSAKKQSELLKKVQAATSAIGSSVGFVADQFAEHMDATTEKAKIEINAYATHTINRAGIAAIGGQTELALSYNPSNHRRSQ